MMSICGIIGASNRNTSRDISVSAGRTSVWRCTLNTLNLTTKRCIGCNEQFPLTPEFWHRKKNAKTGFSGYCKECARKNTSEWRKDNVQRHRDSARRWAENNPDRVKENLKRYHERQKETKERETKLSPVTEKPCSKCGFTFPLTDDFWHRKTRRDGTIGFSSRCKTCRCEKSKQWIKDNPEKRKMSARNDYARRKNAIGKHTRKEIETLYAQQKGLCFHCSIDLSVTGFHPDHWIPLSRGGSNWINNIHLMCPKCNLSKGNKLPHEWSNKYESNA